MNRLLEAFSEILQAMSELSIVSRNAVETAENMNSATLKMEDESRIVSKTVHQLDFIFENLGLLSEEMRTLAGGHVTNHLRLGELLLRDGIIDLPDLHVCLEIQIK